MLSTVNFRIDRTKSLRSVVPPDLILPDNYIDGEPITAIGETLFIRQDLKSVELGNNVLSIEDGAFYENNIKNIKLPCSLLSIGARAFQKNCLTEVIIPSGVKAVYSHAFSDNPLEKIVLPPSLKFIDPDALLNTTDDLIIVCQKDSYVHYCNAGKYKLEILSQEEFQKLYNKRR